MADAPTSVLLLEADDVTQELYQRELGRHYRVLAGRDEAEALLLIQTSDIRAVVLEPEWAGGQGWHLLSTLKRMDLRPPIPVIVISVQDDRRTGYQLGVAAYCIKPVLPRSLLSTVDRILASPAAQSKAYDL